MITELIKPYPGESEESLVKRKAYYIRLLGRILKYCEEGIEGRMNNVKPITAVQREEIDAFWSRYLTPSQRDKLIDYRCYDIYNNVLRDGERLCEYMPDTFYGGFIDDHYGNPQHSKPVDDKNLYDLFFHDINRPKILFRKMYDMLLDGNYNEITLDSAVAIAREHGEVVLKLSRFSGCGHGVIFWNSAKDDETIIRKLLRDSKDVVCQELIEQHSEMARLNPSSVNTLRIITLILHGKIHVLSSIMRMGVNGSKVDNCYSGGVFCGIQSNGQLKNVAYDTYGNVFHKHPQGTAFESVIVPNFNECIDVVTMLAKRFCSVSRLISWDLAIGKDGHPIIVELNVTYGGLDVHQLPNGPIFGDLTEEVLDDVFKNAYTLNSILKSMQ